MTVHESTLTPGTFTLEGKRPHISITPLSRRLPPDVSGGTRVSAPAPRLVSYDLD